MLHKCARLLDSYSVANTTYSSFHFAICLLWHKQWHYLLTSDQKQHVSVAQTWLMRKHTYKQVALSWSIFWSLPLTRSRLSFFYFSQVERIAATVLNRRGGRRSAILFYFIFVFIYFFLFEGFVPFYGHARLIVKEMACHIKCLFVHLLLICGMCNKIYKKI